MKIVIIGDGVAGQNVAEGLRAKDPSMEILILTFSGSVLSVVKLEIAFRNCLPYLLTKFSEQP